MPDSENNTPLHYAYFSEGVPGMFCGNTYITEKMLKWTGIESFIFLLEQGAELSKIGATATNFLLKGAKYNIPQLIDFGVERGADVNGRIEFDLGSGEMGRRRPNDQIVGRSIIHLSAKFNAAKAMEKLIEHGAYISILDTAGQTPFTIAAIKNASDVTKLLLDKGISPDATDLQGVSALQHSLRTASYEVTDLLIENGASKKTPDLTDPHPLVKAADKADSSKFVLLMKLGFDPNLPIENGKVPLHYAALRGKLDVYCSYRCRNRS